VQVTAIAWGINILSGIINTIGTRAIGTVSKVNCAYGITVRTPHTEFFRVVWWTLGGTLFLVISLLVKAPHKVSYFVVLSPKINSVVE
jgi:hypothetical protein